MQKIIACVLLTLVALTGCSTAVPVQPIITYTPSNATTPPPVITPAANAIIIITPNVTGTTIVTNNTVTNQTTMPANNTAPVPVTPDYPNPGGFWLTPAFRTSPAEIPDIRIPHSVNLTVGEAKSIDVTLETRNTGPGEFSGVIFRTSAEYTVDTLPMPDGLKVSVEPPVMASPNNTYSLAITINTSSKLASGAYWLRFECNFIGLKGSGWILLTALPAN